MCLLAGLGIQLPAAAASLQSEVEAAARAAVLETADREGWVAAELQIAPFSAKTAPPCPGGWEVQLLDARSLSRLRLQARCPGKPELQLQNFVLRATLSAEVLVARQGLAAGRPISDADVELQRRDLSQTSDAIGRLEDLQGMTPRSSLRAGQLLQKRQLQAAQLIRRGDRVRIVARGDGIEVHGNGEALEAGTRDALIRVRNSSSGRTITARVLEPGLVEPATP